MIENDFTQPIQAAHMEAALLLSEAVQKATAIGFTLVTTGSTVDVFKWNGKPLDEGFFGDAIFEAEYITNLIDWLDGVAYGRTNVRNENENI